MEKIRKIAKKLIVDNNGDYDKAIKKCVEIILNNKNLLEKYTKPLLIQAIKNLVTKVGHIDRSHQFNGRSPSVPTCPKGVSGETLQKQENINTYAQIYKRQYEYSYWLNLCKKQLGDATKSDLRDEINMYLKNAKTNHKRALYFRSIYNLLQDNKIKVKEAITENKLQELLNTAHELGDGSWNDQFVHEQFDDEIKRDYINNKTNHLNMF